MNHRTPRLAIVGASARAAAFSAIKAGFQVVAADLFADADLQRACHVTRISDYPAGLVRWLDKTECDAWLYAGALENQPDLVDHMASIRPLLGVRGEVLRQVRDPFVLPEALDKADLHFPETRASAAGLPQNGCWLCKTYCGASGSGVWALDGPRALDRATAEGAAFQRVVPGHPAAAAFVLGENRSQLLGLTAQLVGDAWTGAASWQYAGSMGPLPAVADIGEQLDRLGALLAGQFALRGLVGVDLVIDGETAWVLEVNPRSTASMEIVERLTGISSIALHVAACRDSTSIAGPTSAAPVGASDSPARSVGKAIVFARREVKIEEPFFHWAIDLASAGPTHCLAADIPHSGEIIPAGRPVLTVFGEDSGSTCERELRRRVSEVEARLYGDSP